MTCLTSDVRALAQQSVLCWLATTDDQGQPNVSPKEIWAIADDQHVVVAHIASAQSARNIEMQPKVCLSFVDVFSQRGFKLTGLAQSLPAGHAEFAKWAQPLLAQVGQRFAIRSVLRIQVCAAMPILAPSYLFYPEQTTLAGQRAAAMQAYGVVPAPDVNASSVGL